MEEEIKVAKKKTWWDENDILKAFQEVADDASKWVGDVGGEVPEKPEHEYVSSLGEIAGAAKLVNKLLEMTDAN